MKCILIFIMLMGSLAANQDADLSEIRGLYIKAAEQEAAGKKLLEITEGYNVQQPVFFGYKGAGHMMMAKHVINPFSKMSHFNKGKKIFTAAIDRDPGNVELRFLRFSVQAEAPGFLGYKENIEEDKTLLLREFNRIQHPDLQKMIRNYLLSSTAVSESEKEKIRQNIN